MTTILTEFVLRLGKATTEPSAEMFEQVWETLRGILVGEMKRRSAWSNPPRFLGVIGHPVWTAPGTDSDALDELAAECFEFIFVRRLQSLHAQAQSKPTIDGLISLATRHFLLEAQRNNDPLGFRIYEVLHRVARDLLAADRIDSDSAESKVRNETVLAPRNHGGADPPSYEPGFLADPQQLAERWCHEHLEELVTASHRAMRQLIANLGDQLVLWLEEQNRPVRFGTLVNSLKIQCRPAWSLRFVDLGSAEGPLASSEADRFATLSTCVKIRLDRLVEKPRTRTYLHKLWSFLESFAQEGAPAALEWDDELRLPPARQMASLLEIPRNRIPGLLDLVRHHLQACRTSNPVSEEESPMPREPRSISARERAFAATRNRPSLAELDRRPGTSPLARGDIFLVPEADVPGVSWLVLEIHEDNQLHCVPVDTFPFLTPSDQSLETEAEESPWILRNAFRMKVSRSRIPSAQRLEQISEPQLDDALAVEPTLARQDDLTLSAVSEWIEEGPRRARHLLSRWAERPLPFPGPRREQWPRWAAAAMLLTALGLGYQIREQNRQIEDLTTPILGLPYREIQFTPQLRAPWRIEIPEDATHVEIGMVLDSQPAFDHYRIELLSGDRSVYRSPDLEPRGSYSITFPLPMLQGDALQIRLHGLSHEGAVLLDQEPIEILLPASHGG